MHWNSSSFDDGCSLQNLGVFDDHFPCLFELVEATVNVFPNVSQIDPNCPGLFDPAVPQFGPGMIVNKTVPNRLHPGSGSQPLRGLEVERNPEASVLTNCAHLRETVELVW